MASMVFSSLFYVTSPFLNFYQTKTNPSWIPPPATAFLNSSLKNPFRLKSSFVNHGFSFQSLQFPGTILDYQRTTDIVYARAATEESIHDFTVKDIDGKDVSPSKFKGKGFILNLRGLTTSNYTELSQLYEKYKTQGLEILAFPCNQFGGQ
ncbi:hypothetical protein NE237_030203 [Protea cynaroides]|uniref:Glutathione peroxidase n=1 Tax=Protea cynaroides TaxID=273540 RepID=A0A9Q0JVJ2_9MAGN|nr:hypothetical protein NE237_030203 [Protea cynaroides]